MITDFDSLTRGEFIQYIIYVYQSFLIRFDYFTQNEKDYLNDIISKLQLYDNL